MHGFHENDLNKVYPKILPMWKGKIQFYPTTFREKGRIFGEFYPFFLPKKNYPKRIRNALSKYI